MRITGHAKRVLYKLMNDKIIINLDKTAQYQDGWNDSLVATEINKQFPELEMTTNAVANTRSRSWGNLIKQTTGKTTEEIEKLQETTQELTRVMQIILTHLNITV